MNGSSRLLTFLDGKKSVTEPVSPAGGFLIGVLAGTGIGPQVIAATLQVLKAARQALDLKFEIRHGGLIGEDAVAEHGQWLPQETADFCAGIFLRGGAILNGPGGGRYVYDLRRRFDLFCKFVPVRPRPGLVQAAVVTAMENEAAEKRLVAHLVPAQGADATRQNFRRQLPEHMLPDDFVALEKLPVTAAGKTDRRALPPPPQREVKTVLNRARRPRDVIDTRLQRIWEAALNLAPVGRTDDFFELGGTSLQSVEVLLQIEELFGVSLPPSTLVEHNTIEKLSALLADHAVIRSSSPLVKLRDGGGHPFF